MRRLIRIRLHGTDRFVLIGQLFSTRIAVQTSGLYICRASNKGGIDEKRMNLYVHPKPEPSCKLMLRIHFVRVYENSAEIYSH